MEIQGRVVDFQLQPVANAQVSIESDSGILSACDAHDEIPSIQIVTDTQGYFDTDHTAQSFLSFSITIAASGCPTYQSNDLLFSILRQHPLDDEVMTFVMDCER